MRLCDFRRTKALVLPTVYLSINDQEISAISHFLGTHFFPLVDALLFLLGPVCLDGIEYVGIHGPTIEY